MTGKIGRTGLRDEKVSKMLGISKKTYYPLMDRDEDFLHSIRGGRAYYYLKCDEAAVKGEMSATMYVFFAKTKWKHFYPQEDREVQPQKVEVNLTDEQTMKILEIAGQGDVQL